MNRKTIVIGHKNPDTDSICSAIAYAQLKIQAGEKQVIAGRAGNINKQTEFVLTRFNQEAPVFFADIYPRLSDIMTRDVVTVGVDTPILEAMKKFQEEKVRFLPVVDKSNKVTGTLVTLNVAEQFSSHVDPTTARKIFTTPKNIAFATDSKVLVNTRENKEKEFAVFVGAMSGESFNRTIEGYDPSSLIIIVGDRTNILKSAVSRKAALIIVTGGLDVPSKITSEAKKNRVGLMITPHDSASAAWLVKLSASAGRFCSTQFTTFSPKERVETVKKSFLTSVHRGIVVAEENGLLRGVITNSNFLKTPEIQLILVDHNEFSQAVDGADQVAVSEVIDHHRIANFHTAMPIHITVQPVGSTCTLIAERYRDNRYEISKTTAGLLLSGIISDTVTGRSPTTTHRDMESMRWLEGISGVKTKSFSMEMFSASSILGQKSPREVIMNDFKESVIGKYRIGVGQVEVVGFEKFNQFKDEIMKELKRLKQEKGYSLIGLMVTDITYETTLFPVAADQEICNAMGLPEPEKNLFKMKGVLSRKKQVIPHLFNILS